jgi:Ser/Thr protein kinase RdoA (MazF antagonist)
MKDEILIIHNSSFLLSAYDLVPPVEPFPLPHQGKNNIISGLHTGAGDLIWKNYTSASYTDVTSILYEHHLLNSLAAAGLSFAVPASLTTRNGERISQGPYGWAALEPRLPGLPLDPTQLDQVEKLGDALGEFQTALQTYPLTPRPGRPLFSLLFHFPEPVFDPFTLTLAQLDLPASPVNEALLEWWRSEALQLQAFIDGPYRALPWQMCHNDFTPANLLVEGNRVSAVLDFEFAGPAPRALDVAMGLRMTMRYWEHPEPWPAVQRFCRGYARWLALTEAEILALPWLIRLRSAIPTLWWLGRTDIRRDPSRVPLSIGYQQELGRWLDQYGTQWVEVAMEAVTTPPPSSSTGMTGPAPPHKTPPPGKQAADG